MRNLKPKILLAAAFIVTAAFIGLGIYNIASAREEVKVKTLELKNVNVELKELESKHDATSKDLEATSAEKQKIEEQLKVKEQEKADLEAQLQAKIEAKNKIAAAATLSAQASAQPAQKPKAVQVSGSCQDWMNAAGISDQANAYTLIMRESGCNPNAVNKSSGACGIGQQLPCGKWAHQWNDPVGGMIDMQGYVMGRYGSWANAVAHSNARGWY